MNANEDFSHAQQLHRSLMAKSEWTTSLLIDVQRSTDEKLHRRSRMHRQANDFLYDLLQHRSESSCIDDDATLDYGNRHSQVTPDMFVHNEQTSITIDALETIEIGKDVNAIIQRVHIEQERVGRSSHSSFSLLDRFFSLDRYPDCCSRQRAIPRAFRHLL